jgi:hypothetical protein
MSRKIRCIGSHAFRIAAFVDELPEVLGLSESFIFCNGHFRAKEEIRERALVQYSVNHDGSVFDFEVNTPVSRTETIELFVIALDQSVFVPIELLEIAFLYMELIEQFELLHGAHLRHFRGTEFVEDNFQHVMRVKKKS